MERLLVEMVQWVCCQWPASLEAAVTLAEDHLPSRAEGLERVSQPLNRQGPVQGPRLGIPAPVPVERTLVLRATNRFFSPASSPQGPGTASTALEPAVQMPGQSGSAGVPELRAAGTPEVGVSADCVGSGVPCRRGSGTLPRSSRNVQCYSVLVRSQGSMFW